MFILFPLFSSPEKKISPTGETLENLSNITAFLPHCRSSAWQAEKGKSPADGEYACQKS